MSTWNDLLDQIGALVTDEEKSQWVERQTAQAMADVAAQCDGRNVIYYASAFLQKGSVVPADHISIGHEDLNGLMAVIHGMDCTKGLTLMLHTPGGSPNAAETLVAYLRSKFDYIEVVIPALAMSAGTMMALASDRIVMGRQSQLGPIDTQFSMGGRFMSARGIVEQFKRAQQEILQNPMNAHVWAPITQSLGPAMLQDAQHALDYSEEMVAKWLATWMFSSDGDAVQHGKDVARHFNDATTHKSHGRRIDYTEALAQRLKVERLEDSQDLQEAVLTLYHLVTLVFEQSLTTKVIMSSNGGYWAKNFGAAP